MIHGFLFKRKVRLKVNSYTGPCGKVGAYGLPQGSALSPFLFKFYIQDLIFTNQVSHLHSCNSEDISPINVLKFADDATVVVFGDDTKKGVAKLKYVCSELSDWCSKWKMVINCDSNKTDYMCFATAEGNADLVPSTIPFGLKTVKRVDTTCVLGIRVDSKLKFDLLHGQSVYSRLIHRWSSILKHGNKNWGLSYRVTINLIKVLFLPCLFYGGVVWINQCSITEINKLWYKILKSTLGATLNVKLELCDIITGLPPLMVQNSVNTIKHMLKLNICKNENDPLRTLVSAISGSTNMISSLRVKIHNVFKFLQWKQCKYSSEFSDSDKIIVQSSDYGNFIKLSSKCCSYTKSAVKAYNMHLWQDIATNKYLLDGHSTIPTVSCDALNFKYTSRKIETLALSLLYPNNLLNSFLFTHFPICCETPLCGCCENVQSLFHVVFE